MTIWAKEPSNGYSLAPDTPWILHKTLLLPQYGNKCQIYIWPRKKLIFVKCPGRTKMGKSFNVTAYWLQAFGWKNVKIHWKQFVTLLIEQIQSKHNKNMITACHNNDIIFFLLSRDIRFFKKGHQKRPMGQTRWPTIFSSLDMIWSQKSKPNLNIFSNWGFWYSSVLGGRILLILQECPPIYKCRFQRYYVMPLLFPLTFCQSLFYFWYLRILTVKLARLVCFAPKATLPQTTLQIFRNLVSVQSSCFDPAVWLLLYFFWPASK